jgi:hypothetical protein
VIWFSSCRSKSSLPDISIVPQPVTLIEQQGRCILPDSIPVFCSTELTQMLKVTISQIKASSGVVLYSVTKEKETKLFIQTDSLKGNSESDQLDVIKNKITIFLALV